MISACAAADAKYEGFFKSIKGFVNSYCSPLYSSATRMLAKCALCSLAKFQEISEDEFKLDYSELDILQTLLSLAAKDSDGDCNAWPVYTLTTAHYLHFLLLLCYRLSLLSEHNAKLFAKSVFKEKTVFDTLNVVFEFHTEEKVLKNALLFLEAMIHRANLQTISPQLVSLIRGIIFSSTSSTLQDNAYFCIRSLGLEAEVAYDSGKTIVLAS